MSYLFFFFFFKAEDGIRVLTVTGVQTCALPISAAGVRIEDDVALRGHPHELVRVGAPVGRVRPAVNFENHRVLAARVEAGRLEDPSLNLLAVEAGVPNLLRLALCDVLEQIVVDMGGRTERCPRDIQGE